MENMVAETSSTRDSLLLPTFMLVLFSVFTLLFFNPLQIAISSPDRLGYLSYMFVAVLFAISLVLSVLLTLLKYVLGRRYFNVLLVLAAFLFIYSSLVNPDYGLFRGDRFGDEDKLYSFLTSTTIFIEWVVLCALSFALIKLATKAPSVFPVIFLCLFMGSAIDLSLKLNRYFTEIANMEQVVDRGIDRVFTFSQTGQNILLFIPDAGAGYLLPGLFSEKSLREGYRGFTYYPNTVSVGTFTMPSAAALIAGEAYTPARINADNSKVIVEHLGDAYNWLTATLAAHEYESILIHPKWMNCADIAHTKMCKSSIKGITQLSQLDRLVEDDQQIDSMTIAVFSIFKVLPVSLKPLFYGSDLFRFALSSEAQLAIAINYRYEEFLYLRHLSDLSEASAAANQFIHIWSGQLVGPFGLNEQCEALERTFNDLYLMDSRINSTRCVLDALAAWFRWMKQNQVFDNTKIIIVADHGAHNYGNDWVRGAVNPILLVKDFNQSEPLETSNILMQNSDAAAIICASLASCTDISPDPTKNPVPGRVATYYHTTHGNTEFIRNSKQFEIKGSFDITGDVWDDPRFDLKGIMNSPASATQ